jgi:PilZ domain
MEFQPRQGGVSRRFGGLLTLLAQVNPVEDMQDSPRHEDKRDSPRHRVMKPGVIGFDGSGVGCLVCNVSQSGAAIEIKGKIGIPESFHLMVESEQINKDCRVVWRKYQRLGVAFI